MATMRRTLLRAGIGLKYSEGFNPHPYLSVALPLPVGCGSYCERMDVGLLEEMPLEGIPGMLSAAAPPGLEVAEAYMPTRKFSEIAWIGLEGLLHYDSGAPEGAVERLMSRYGEEKIVISKKTKRGVSDIDIAPHIREVSFEGDDAVTMAAKVSAVDPALSPENVMSALDGAYKEIAPDFALFARTEVYDRDMNVFR